MVERDRFEKQFGAGWRSAYRYARDGQVSPEALADKLVTSLARALREQGGIPAFSDIVRILTTARELGVLPAFSALDDFAELENGHRHTRIAAEVAKSLIVQLEATGWSVEAADIPVSLAEASSLDLIEHYYFGNARRRLMAEGKFANYEEVTKWQGQLEELLRPQVSRIAERLARNPGGIGLRAPKRLTKKERTSDLLDENILGMNTSRSPTGSTFR